MATDDFMDSYGWSKANRASEGNSKCLYCDGKIAGDAPHWRKRGAVQVRDEEANLGVLREPGRPILCCDACAARRRPAEPA